MTNNDFLWVDKYRPKTIEECALPQRFKELFQGMIKEGEITNLIITGAPGCGKTSVAMALLDQMNREWMYINASLKKGMELVRSDIMDFASTVGYKEGRKYVILDEADGILKAAQDGLRAFIEGFSSNCGYIFICNDSDKLIEALHSRSSLIRFDFGAEDYKDLLAQFGKGLVKILEAENITFDKKVLVEFIKKHYPDFRRILNELQSYSLKNRTIDTGILSFNREMDCSEVISFLQDKKWNELCNWVFENGYIVNNLNAFAQNLQKQLKEKVTVGSMADFVIEYNEADYRQAFVIDKEANVLTFLTKLMAGLAWK